MNTNQLSLYSDQTNKDSLCCKPEMESASGDLYEQPEVTDDVRKKIKELQEIAQSIEEKVISPSGIKIDKNKFKIDYENKLNDHQLLAVTTTEGPLLINAGAGSGKTRVIVYRVAFLIENGVFPQNILLLTFTNKAAEEMISRVSELLGDTKCKQIQGGTFHSFCLSLLRKYHSLLGVNPKFTILDTKDSEDVIDLIRIENGYTKQNRAFPKKDAIQEIISSSRNCKIPVRKVIEKNFPQLDEYSKDVKVIKIAYKEYKKAHNLYDFDDLNLVILNALMNNSRFRKLIQNKFQYIMVDEYQDTNLIEKELVDLIATGCRNIAAVGDEFQSMYAFRGANYENILRFPETYPDCKVVKLEQNYRSNQGILDFANAIMDNKVIGFKKKLFTTNKSDYKPVVQKFYSQEDEAEFIGSSIQNLREKDLPLEKIAVLSRLSCNLAFVEAELLKRRIPYEVVGGLKFVERRHIKDMISYLRILHNPYDAVAWNRILKLIPGIGTHYANMIVDCVKKWSGKIYFFKVQQKKFSDDLIHLGVTLNQIMGDEIGISKKLEVLINYYAPILEKVESDYKLRLLDIDVLHTLARKYNNLEQFLTDFALNPPSNRFQSETTPQVGSKDEKRVRLTTVHSAKGLEWHTVFVVHMLDGIFPSVRSLNTIEELEEERRLFFVASTRAEEQLFLTMPSYVAWYNGHFTMPSRFIAEIDKSKYKLL